MIKPSPKALRRCISPVCLPVLVGLAIPGATTAAPLDELLSVQEETRPLHGEVEAGWDAMNSTIDLFRVRKEDPRGKSIGDYEGQHLRGGLALDKRLWVDGGFWNSTVKTPFDEGKNRTYQAGIQYRVVDNKRYRPAISLRISGWGNGTGQIYKGSSTPVFGTGISADSFTIKDPSDRQFQGDVIGSWALTPSTSISLFTSYGVSQVSIGDTYATLYGCNYKLDRVLLTDEVNGGWDTGVHGVAVNAKDPNCGLTEFTQSMSFYNAPDLPPGMYVSYDADYLQFGGMIQWRNEDWRLKLGYRLQTWDRGPLDEAVSTLQHADKTVYKTNNHITGEVSYKIHPQVALFLRSQYMTNQFLGDVPYAYNLLSSHQFDKPYGLVSLGISAGF
ncbi:MAG: hypothetical protein HQL75_08470 [Magnetococcales bacterium]|nr:hypothetical protein [Magnetococcales bacterium]